MLACVLRKLPCLDEGNTFYCVNGLCPFGYDPFVDCFSFMSEEQRELFMELKLLRSLIAGIAGGKNERV